MKPKARRRFPRRWPMLRLTDLLISRMPSPQKKADLLILRMFGIGDALIFRMVLEKYAEAFNLPLSQITVFGSLAWKAAADLYFSDVEVILIDERRFAKNFLYRMRIMLMVRRRGFYTAICGMRYRYPHVIESLMLASAAPRCIVAEARPNEKFDAMFAHYRQKMTRTIVLAEAERPRAADGRPLTLTHEIDQQLSFLSEIAGRPITLSALPKFTLPAGAPSLIKNNERYAVLNIGASHEPRRWPLSNFGDIARLLLDTGTSVVFLGGPSELPMKDEMMAMARTLPSSQEKGRGRVIVSIGELSFTNSTHLVAKADLVVSNDSGLGHLALLLDRPAVLIVGGGHFGSFMPYPQRLTREKVRFLYHLMPCYHCNWNCTMMPPGGKIFPCVTSVSVDHVWLAIKDINK